MFEHETVRHRQYLGDSVYVGMNACDMVVLTTENGMGTSNAIYLEEETMAALLRWLARVKAFPESETADVETKSNC